MTNHPVINVGQLAKSRYTTKAFDADKKIPPELMQQLESVLHFAPSSVNSQPWHFFIAETTEGKERIARATQPPFDMNLAKVRNASHVVVFSVRADLDEAYVASLLEQEERAGRLAGPEAKAKQQKTRQFFIDQHRYARRDIQPWMERQLYLALGSLLFAAAAAGVDACPMEGFDARLLDAELGLCERGLTSLVLVALGYRSSADFNAGLAKARLPMESVISRL